MALVRTRWGRLTGTILLAVVAASTGGKASAQAFRYNQEVECGTVPVSGFDFKKCWVSNDYQSGLNLYRGWRLAYSDPTSKVFLNYIKPLNRGYFTVEHPDRIVQSIRDNNSALRDELKAMYAVGRVVAVGNDRFFSFNLDINVGCGGFVRYGPQANFGAAYLVQGFFCRQTRDEITVQETKFFTDALQFK